MDNIPPGITEYDIDRQFGADAMSDTDLSEYIDDNIDVLRDYHAHKVAPEILDDDLADAFNAWVANLSEEELINIVNK